MQLHEEKVDFISPIEKVKPKVYLRSAPYFCPDCRRAWQPHGHESIDAQRTPPMYLQNFPTIGCYRLKCSRCK